MNKNVINIIGLAGSGKSQICEFLNKEFGFFIYRPSDLIRHFANENGRELASREDYVNCHIELINSDRDAMIRPVLDSTEKRICIDGLRAPAPMQRLRNQLGAFSIFLVCPAAIRYDRIFKDINRQGHRKPPSLDNFIVDEAVDYQTVNQELPSVTIMEQTADFTIDASKSLEQVTSEVKDIVSARLAKQ